MPQDAHPDQPDGERGSARGPSAPVRSLPPKPETPAEVAAGQDAATRPATKRPAKRASRQKVVADPGPPPPLPPDLVIPPKPPLPLLDEPAATSAETPIETPDAVVPDQAIDTGNVVPPVPEPMPERGALSAPIAAVIVAEPEVIEAVPEVAEAELIEAVPEVAEPATAEVPEPLVTASVDTATAALVVKGVTKGFGETRAVDGIDLTVPAGIFYGLVGPNGAGKTTTLSMIAGLLRPDRGTIRVNGVDAQSDPLGAKRQMGVLPDRLRTFDRLTGRQLLHYYGVLRGLPAAVVESRTTDLARAFDLSDALGRVVSDYSAGMAKKVMLAGAMIHSPRLLVLDEPFEAVDPVSSAIILDILSTYVAHGGTVILSSHGMDLVERVCSRVAVIVAGQVLAEGTVDEVRGELTLEQRFIELAGGLTDVEGLEWLHTFSD
ncbi:MAG: ATP-binding cassette domain-containing protein [Microbacterium sp.]